ncbi:MAG: GMC family oxidoreductase N-terminal domain-containing protein [Chloroflexi bacterium]|nr:GMC family oxidoreductase N-terminal domain-containing protein [Chloroflexota bacterium]
MITADYIVVGAGSAGAAVASRLSEDETCSVALLEAGGPDSNPNIRIPARFSDLFHTEDDWDYQTVPQPGLNNRREYVPRGKVLGGTSSMNAMVYQRGHPSDYDGWAARGNEGWAYHDVLPFFRKMQHQERGESAHHGVGGPINVADPQDPNPLSLAFVEAALELGFARNADFNDGDQEGFGVYQVTQKRAQRHSTAAGYLRPALQRENLTAITRAQATRLIIENRQCTGLQYFHDGELKTARAEQEVIICGGAINSPQLLLLSGIGPADQLAEFDISLVMDLPGVGQNLMDHIQVPLAYHCQKPVSLVGKDAPAQVRRYQEERMGLLTSNLGESGGFVKLNPNAPAPELQYHFGPDWFVRHGFETPAGHGFTILVGLVGAKSAGELKLLSADPLAPPSIDFACLEEDDDVLVLLEGLRLGRRIAAASPFDPYRGAELLPGAQVIADGELVRFIREFATTIYHPTCSCRMGRDPLAVVDERLRVHGIAGLRVADASIMPHIINANTNAPCIMIGEKAAAMIREDR